MTGVRSCRPAGDRPRPIDARGSTTYRGDVTEFRISAIATGGDAVSRAADGRVAFIRGALPGELVRADIVKQAKDFVRGVTVEVVEAADRRRTPSCPHVSDGCGGCGWQHVALDYQRELKRQIVVDSLTRIAKLTSVDPLVTIGPELSPGGHRTTVRAVVAAGHVGFRSYRSHEPVLVGSCEVTDPVLEDLLMRSDFADATEVTLRRGIRTGEVIAIVDDEPGKVRLASNRLVTRATVVGSDVLASVDQPTFHEIISGHKFSISAGSFFQTRTDGAELLVRLVRDGLSSFAGQRAVLADLYGGVGLFAATLAEGFSDVVSVEREGCSARDAKRNLEASRSAHAVASDVDDFDLAGYAKRRPTMVVADPARGGLGRAGVERITEAAPLGIVLVSCDAGSLGRDAGLLAVNGYELRSSVLVDMFPHTPHVEVVSCFDPPL